MENLATYLEERGGKSPYFSFATTGLYHLSIDNFHYRHSAQVKVVKLIYFDARPFQDPEGDMTLCTFLPKTNDSNQWLQLHDFLT